MIIVSLGEKIRALREAAGMSQDELGTIVGRGKQAVSDWELNKSGPNRKLWPILAAALRTDIDSLLSESGTATTGKKKPLFIKSKAKNPPRLAPDVPMTESAGGLLPLISWEQVASWGEKLGTITEVKEWLPCEAAHSALAFWLEVAGISMYVPGGEVSFREGDKIAVDPERKPAHMDFVVVSVDGDLYLRQLVIDGGKKFLKAIAPGWPNALAALRGKDRIVGKVIKLQPKGKVFA